MTNPYKILGVEPNATDDEIKKAYRALAKKYHPDNYQDSPLLAQAQEKMKEINEAYDMIQRERAGGAGSGMGTGGAYDPFGGAGTGHSSKEGIYYQVRVLINQGRFSEADIILSAVPAQQRTAEWYYLRGCVLYRRQWYYDAEVCFRRACEMDPTETEYREALENIQEHASQARQTYTRTSESGVCNICSSLLCMNCLCNCCGCDGPC